MAIGAFVCGVLCCVPIAPLIGVFLGFKALNDLQPGSAMKGRELAIVGLVLSGLGIASQCLSIVGAIIGES